jgi:hypothetical protein
LNLSRVLIVGGVLLVGAGCGTPPEQKPPVTASEICGNALDDDDNGKTDCEDPACAEQSACQVVAECHTQSDCLAKDGRKYKDYINDPIPQCVQKQCVRPTAQVNMHFFVKNNWTGLQGTIQSVNTRFVKKADVNGEPVNCASLQLDAPSHAPEDADQIERTKKYNLQAYDVTSLAGLPGGTTVQVPLMNISTGADFIIWTELWNQKASTTTQLPQGKRIGWGCFETGPAVAEVVPEDDETRGITVMMPNPQNP